MLKPIRGIAGNAWQTQQSHMAQAAAAGMTPQAPAETRRETAADSTPAAADAPNAILVATRTCPNCGAAKKMLDQAHISYQVIYADEPEGMTFAEANDIIQAPTLLMPAAGGYEKYTNINEISAFMKGRAPVTA